jgi:hypothetical protein
MIRKKKMCNTKKKKLLDAQIKGKKLKKEYKLLKKQQNKEKKREQKNDAIKLKKKLAERERRKNKKILSNDEHDQKILNSIHEIINTNQKFKKHFDFTYHTQVYEPKQIIMNVIKHIKYAIPWNVTEQIPASTVYGCYSKMKKLKILEKVYITNLQFKINEELKNNKNNTCTMSDVTCVSNKYGIDKVEYNGQKKRKVTKISLITYGKYPISHKIDYGARHDSKILYEQLNNSYNININVLQSNNEYFLADSAYDWNKLKEKLIKMKYVPIIGNNKRNNKMNHDSLFTSEEKKVYRERIKIEHTNRIIKNHRRVNCRYDRTIESFQESLLLSFIDLILNQ